MAGDSDAIRILLGVRVSTVCCDQMNRKTEKAHRSDPRNAGQDQPENTDKYSPVIDLPESRDQQTQNTCKQWFSHSCINASSEGLRSVD